jgi:DNA-binding GntR family transcriptional regulator
MTVQPRIDSSTIISALADLDYFCRGTRVTPEQVAKHLECDLKEVKDYLRVLEAKRIIKRKKSKGETVIEPWGGQRL